MIAVLSIALAGFLGYCLGIRRERGRYRMYRELVEERKRQGGIRLRRIRVRQ